MVECLISLGSNQGDRQQILANAADLLGQQQKIRIVSQSAWQATQPVGGPEGQGEFLNGAVRCFTTLSPDQLLGVLQAIENQFGRQRTQRWGERTLDLDLLLYDQEQRRTPALELPHPRMTFRRFVLEPAAEAAPSMRHPTVGWTIKQLLSHLNTSANYAALAGASQAVRTAIAQAVAARDHAALENDRVHLFSLADTISPAGQVVDQGQRALLEQAIRRQLRDSRPMLSDCWLEQTLAPSAATLPPVAILPRLIIWVETPDDPLAQAAMQQLVARPHVGPVLRVDGSDLANAAMEAAAAIAAMQ